MKKPEDVLYDLVDRLARVILTSLVKPDMEIGEVTDLSGEEIDKLIENNIKGLIVDVDETLRFDGNDIPAENEEWLNMIKDKLKILILSNGMDGKLRDKFAEMNIVYIEFALKPFKHNFKKALSILNLRPEEVAVIGDDLFDDIHGGNRNSMFTIKVSNDKKLVKKI